MFSSFYFETFIISRWFISLGVSCRRDFKTTLIKKKKKKNDTHNKHNENKAYYIYCIIYCKNIIFRAPCVFFLFQTVEHILPRNFFFARFEDMHDSSLPDSLASQPVLQSGYQRRVRHEGPNDDGEPLTEETIWARDFKLKTKIPLRYQRIVMTQVEDFRNFDFATAVSSKEYIIYVCVFKHRRSYYKSYWIV